MPGRSTNIKFAPSSPKVSAKTLPRPPVAPVINKFISVKFESSLYVTMFYPGFFDLCKNSAI